MGSGPRGVLGFGRPGRWRHSTAWLRENAGLSIRLGGDFAINIGGIALTTSLLAGLLGLAATGGLRFAQTLLGPIQVLFGAVAAFMVPFLVRRLAGRGSLALRRPALLLSLCCFLASAIVVALLMALPDVAGRELLGDSWDNARAVLLPVGVTQSAIAIALGGGFPLPKAMGRADLLLRVTLIQAPLIFGLALGGGGLARHRGRSLGHRHRSVGRLRHSCRFGAPDNGQGTTAVGNAASGRSSSLMAEALPTQVCATAAGAAAHCHDAVRFREIGGPRTYAGHTHAPIPVDRREPAVPG